MESRTATPNRAGNLAMLAIPALVVGVVCSLILLAISFASEQVQDLMWERLPAVLALDGSSPWWVLGMLTLTGVAVGLLLWKMPAGPDPATEDLVGPPLPVRVLPGMLLATMLSLAGGVSLGPENPITAANIALAVALGTRLVPAAEASSWLGLAAAGTIGALFGTPVAAALILSEMTMGPEDSPLWDRLFAPLIAAGAGAITTHLLATPVLSLQVPDYTLHGGDLITAAVITTAGAILGLAAVAAFPHLHRLFHRLPSPPVRLALGGLALGLLGVIGGQITLFKGLDEMKELTSDAAAYTAAGLALLIVVKLAALVIAATSGFVGGRIFPAVFVGVALGLFAHSLVPAIPVGLGIAAGVLGIVLAVTQQGWLSLFMAAATVTDLDLLPVLCLALLPAWLLITGKPQMIIRETG